MCELELAGGISSGQWGKDTIARVEGLIKMAQPTPSDDVVHDFQECFKMLLNGRDVYSHDLAGRTLASYYKDAVSLPDSAGEARNFTTSPPPRLAGFWRRRTVSRCCGAQWKRSRISPTLVSVSTAIPYSSESMGSTWVSLSCRGRDTNNVSGLGGEKEERPSLCAKKMVEKDEIYFGLSTIKLVVQTTATCPAGDGRRIGQFGSRN